MMTDLPHRENPDKTQALTNPLCNTAKRLEFEVRSIINLKQLTSQGRTLGFKL